MNAVINPSVAKEMVYIRKYQVTFPSLSSIYLYNFVLINTLSVM